MSKRVADTVLTQDNWDQPDQKHDDSEIFGEIKTASTEILATRKIAKARRKKTDDPTSNPFLAKTFNNPFAAKPIPDSTVSTKMSVPTSSNAPDDDVKDEKFQKAVALLNTKFVESVTKFVENNNCVDLNPCFISYKSHFDKIVKTYATSSVLDMIERQKLSDNGYDKENEYKAEVTPEQQPSPAATPPPNPRSFFFKPVEKGTESISSTKPPPFSFSSASTPAVTSPEPKKTGFSFKFGSAAPQPPTSTYPPKAQDSQNSQENPDEPTDEVPDVEDKKFSEEDVIFEERCKLYYKKESGFKERGVGTIYIKKSPDGKGQILIRAENASGTILLNSALSSGMPVSKSGRCNIMLVCQVNPEIPKEESLTGTTNPFLIKVKAVEAAEKILKTIQEFVG